MWLHPRGLPVRHQCSSLPLPSQLCFLLQRGCLQAPLSVSYEGCQRLLAIALPADIPGATPIGPTSLNQSPGPRERCSVIGGASVLDPARAGQVGQSQPSHRVRELERVTPRWEIRELLPKEGERKLGRDGQRGSYRDTQVACSLSKVIGTGRISDPGIFSYV